MKSKPKVVVFKVESIVRDYFKGIGVVTVSYKIGNDRIERQYRLDLKTNLSLDYLRQKVLESIRTETGYYNNSLSIETSIGKELEVNLDT